MKIAKQRFALSLIIAVAGCFWSASVFAQDTSAQFGILYGLSVPDAPNTVPHHLYGVKGVAFVMPSFGLGGYYLVSGQSEGSGGEVFDYSIHGIETEYLIPTAKGATAVGLRIGLTKIHEVSGGTKIIFSPYHYGLVVAHDFYVMPWLAMGFEGSYLHVQDSKTDKGGTRYELESFGMINFLVTTQFRF